MALRFPGPGPCGDEPSSGMMQFLGCGPGPADIPLGDSHRPAELPRVASHGGNLTDGLPSFPDPGSFGATSTAWAFLGASCRISLTSSP